MELKPCPFCGGEASVIRAPYANTVFIQCTSCQAMMGRYNKTTIGGHKLFKVHCETEEMVVEAWNRRVNDG